MPDWSKKYYIISFSIKIFFQAGGEKNTRRTNEVDDFHNIKRMRGHPDDMTAGCGVLHAYISLSSTLLQSFPKWGDNYLTETVSNTT
jgi:hypothetical protein